jgi:hypothetical protein
MTVTTLRRLLAPLAAALFALLLAVAGATTASADTVPAPTNPSGFLRVGHLAPDVGPVDVSLTRADGGTANVLTTAPYGAFTPYQTLTPGFYTVAMRPAGAAAATEPMLSAPVTVDKGKAYTLLATGTRDALKTSLINDDLTKPPTDTSRVRLVQGSTAAPTLTVAAVGGPTLSRDLAYGQATGYANVPQGRWTLQVLTPDGSEAMTSAPVVDLAAGSVNSLLVTNAPGGGFAITPVVDAKGIDPAMAPTGGIQTGLGGTATDVVNAPGSHVPSDLGATAALALLLGVTMFGVAARRRRLVTVRK